MSSRRPSSSCEEARRARRRTSLLRVAELETRQDKREKPWPWVIAGSGAAVAVGSLLPWATLTTAFGNVSKNGTDGDGTITLIAGVVLAILGVAMRTNTEAALRWLVLLGAAGVGVVAGIDFADVQRVAGNANSDYARISVGAGLYVVALGAAGAFVGALASFSD